MDKLTKKNDKERNQLKNLCPICLGKLKNSEHSNCFPKGKILVKKENYVLLTVSKKEPIITKMLKITNNQKDKSKTFILLYVDKKIAGYKGTNETKFLFGFSNYKHKEILKNYTSRKERRERKQEMNWENRLKNYQGLIR